MGRTGAGWYLFCRYKEFINEIKMTFPFRCHRQNRYEIRRAVPTQMKCQFHCLWLTQFISSSKMNYWYVTGAKYGRHVWCSSNNFNYTRISVTFSITLVTRKSYFKVQSLRKSNRRSYESIGLFIKGLLRLRPWSTQGSLKKLCASWLFWWPKLSACQNEVIDYTNWLRG